MKRVSQRDIAAKLKVNVSTVSRALRGLDGVSPELRQKIESLADEQGYHPNPFAMSLRYDTTRTIGIVVPDVSYSPYAHFVKYLEAEARKRGYMCIITDTNEQYENEKNCLELLVNMHVEGIIMCLSQETTDYSHLLQLKQHHIPLVLFDRASDIDISSVVINDVDSAYQATSYLIESGARRIAFLGASNHVKQTSDRKHGYLKALRKHHLPIHKELIMCHPISFNSGLFDTIELLNLPEPPDALLATHGLLVGSSFQTILSQGLRIPEDISIIGYMSNWVSDMSTPRMTFVKQNLKEIAQTTFQLLLDQMNGDDSVKHLTVKATLEIRESTRKVNNT